MRQSDVEITSDLVAGAALLLPSFQRDLSTWRMVIRQDGTLFQELSPGFSCSHIYDCVTVKLETKVDEAVISVLQSLAQEINFFGLQDSYHGGVTDFEMKSITIRQGTSVKRVTVYAAEYLAGRERMPEIDGYLRLWDLLTYLTPFRGTSATALPAEEAKRRLNSHR